MCKWTENGIASDYKQMAIISGGLEERQPHEEEEVF